MIPGVNKETRLLYKLSICDPDNSWSRVLPFSLKIPLFQRVDFAFNNQLKTTVFNDYLQMTQTGF